ncbi:putative Transmembrane protein [Quillaja saponaria]|uniref:Transmembrane protein n=1 Tax=Quillaja saponaria TaxID=32244 RepID=A0AAD7M4R2_QUISA|nr:putative Transmembrane protein [Quillaja saponaria]
MVKELKYMRNYYEVAPSLLITHERCSDFPKLEPIIEEGSEFSFEVQGRRVLFLLPLFVSFFSYFFLYRLTTV